ncbi:TnsA endonuclease N-terminal domain-containing protein [Devosia rhizoryzae]|uniref:Uncharacterized protein n=1 Tax=Devosia rhizoryzae TaxID=2774137 RepID=A0ABX7C442_9HYPH|nr:TnsA endonuclease N-terminal domain-containing protein [Devosia rhizoryzae]QQR39005.1 hypothetical protein JI748_14855 [Devosia rhizoryzae]
MESWWLQVLMAHPDVHEIREQQLLEIPVGQNLVKHYFDFVVIWKDGSTSACAVKYRKDSTGLDDLLKAAAKEVGDAFASDYRIFGEDGINRTMLWNASWVIRCGKDHDYEAQAALAGVLANAGRSVRVADCDAIVGDGQRGSRAAIALIKSGKLVIPADERLGRDTVLGNLFTN